MKLEHLYLFINNFLNNFSFYALFLFRTLTNFFFIKLFFSWKTFNSSDYFWFLFSNKKSIYELRYLNINK